jgi:hypothetical protein
LANALLGAAQIEAMLAETLAEQDVDLAEAHDQQLVTAGVSDDPVKLTGFLQWQTLRVSGPLRLIAQDPSTGPFPLAAAHAADGLQRLLGVVAAGQVPSVEQAAEHVAQIEAARECFVQAIGTIDILLDMLGGLAEGRRGDHARERCARRGHRTQAADQEPEDRQRPDGPDGPRAGDRRYDRGPQAASRKG